MIENIYFRRDHSYPGTTVHVTPSVYERANLSLPGILVCYTFSLLYIASVMPLSALLRASPGSTAKHKSHGIASSWVFGPSRLGVSHMVFLCEVLSHVHFIIVIEFGIIKFPEAAEEGQVEKRNKGEGERVLQMG